MMPYILIYLGWTFITNIFSVKTPEENVSADWILFDDAFITILEVVRVCYIISPDILFSYQFIGQIFFE